MKAKSADLLAAPVTPKPMGPFPGTRGSWIKDTVFAVVLAMAALGSVRADELEQSFRHPPSAARPWVFWYWMRGAVSREGITADLAAMKQAGIGGAYLFTIGAPTTPPEYTPTAEPLTPEWWALVRHAASEADRLGVSLGLDVGDGFATAGGRWITPELAMQKVVWSETTVEGGRSAGIVLPQPPTNEGFYRDIAVLAFPTPEGEGVSTLTTPVKVTTSVAGIDPQFLATGGNGSQQLRSDAPCWIQYAFEQPFTLRSVVISQWPRNFTGVYHATRLKIEASDDGATFRPVGRLEPPRHGWQDWDAGYTFSVPPVTARYFRFVHDPAGVEPGREDLNGAKWKPRLLLRGLVLSAAPRIDNFEGKSGVVWRRAEPAATSLPSAACIPAAAILDLSARLDPAGRLAWTPPPGRWTILRVGHTPTGHRNETGGGASGFECDKLDAQAARVQFEHWFGETTRQLGPELTRRVLKIFHVDSWEAGSQNWTTAFAAEFEKRRGYAPTRFLPAFAGFGIEDNATSERFLHDVRRTITELTTENFFGTLASLAHEHGCEFSAEATAPTMVGDGMAHYAQADIPMGEFWLRSPTHDKPADIADAISGAHVYGRRIVQAEAFTELRMQWDEHPGLLKALGDHEFTLGINRLVLHVFTHNPWLDRRPGMTLSNVGVLFQRDQTWWPDARGWTDYLSRCQALLQAGRPVTDVAYFTGEELPRRAFTPDRLTPALPTGYAADSVNPDALVRLARLENGELTLPGGSRYAALVMPAQGDTVSTELVQALSRFTPLLVPPRSTITARLAAAGVSPDLLATDSDGRTAQGIEWIHRATDSAEIYFVSNQRDAARDVRISVRIPRPLDRTTGTTQLEPIVELWDPVTGEIHPARFRRHQGRIDLQVPLAPFGSRFVIVRHHPTGAVAMPASNAPTTTSVATLSSPWRVTFAPGLGGPGEPITFPELIDWTTCSEPGVRSFSGTASYRQEFTWNDDVPRRLWLDLGKVANLAHIFVNGVDCGIAWTPPYRVEIAGAMRRGTNSLEIRVTNTWANRLTADRTLTPRVTWTTAAPREKETLLPAGLLGPVQLVTERDNASVP